MAVLLTTFLKQCRKYVKVTAYTLDDYFWKPLEFLLAGSFATVQVIVDLHQFENSSANNQHWMMKKLLTYGAKLRKRRCERSGADEKYAAQHEKVWILDGELLLLTSMNATRNSVTNCEEAGVFLRTEREIQFQEAHFDSLFAGAQPVSLEQLPLGEKP